MPSSIARAAERLSYKRVGLSDGLSLSAYAPFYHACICKGITPYFGMDIAVQGTPLALYIANEEGYRSLLAIYYLAQKRALTPEDFKSCKGLYAVLDGHSLDESHLLDKDYPMFLYRLSGCFMGFYVGIPYLPKEPEKVSKIREFAALHSYKAIAFPLICYEKEDDQLTLDILRAIEENTKIDQEHKQEKGFMYFLSKEEAEAYFHKEEIDSLEEIAAKLSFDYPQKRGALYRHKKNPEGLSSTQYLRKLALEGLQKKNPNYDQRYAKRLDYELSIIEKMGFCDYFLTVADYVHYAKTHDITVGPGRGSAGGSLVSYALDIVEVDPIRFSLLFERFLNPERTSMPDIDVDFNDQKRDRLIAYLKDKYGEERVANVLTTVYIGARQSLHDIRRVYDLPERDLALLSRAISDPNASLRENYKNSPSFRRLVDSDRFYLDFVKLATRIEGLPRQAGLHAAGVVIDDAPLSEVLPTKIEPGTGLVACLEKAYLEEQGFLKMDILGLRNLSLVDACLDLYEKHTGKKVSFYEIPFDEEGAIALVRSGETYGLFQLESPGMRKTVRMVKPTSFLDVAAIIALFRPGPMEQIPNFARRKAGQERISYPSPELSDILKETYGIIVYQEQIMQIATLYAGFSPAKADMFRKAISKKDPIKIAALEKDFKEGAIALGHSKENADSVYSLIYKFASYGFNKSHAVAYAMLSTRMAYMKKHMAGEFYSAVLSNYSLDDKKFKDALREAKSHGYRLLCPDINRSIRIIENHGKDLILSLGYIKKLNGRLIEGILLEREENGPYQDLFDFTLRVKKYGLNTQALIRLIDAGALDCFGLNRTTLRGAAFSSLEYAEMLMGESGNAVLLDLGLEKPLIEMRDEDQAASLAAEREALGAYISASPLEKYSMDITREHALPIEEAYDAYGDFLTRGIVSSLDFKITKTGEQMAFLEIYDENSSMRFSLFSEVLDKSRQVLSIGNSVLIRAHKENRKGSPSYTAGFIRELKENG